MLIIGGGGHSKVICSILELLNIPVDGIFDDNLVEKEMINGYPVLGPYQHSLKPNEELLIAIGNNSIRKRKSSAVKHRFGKLAHLSTIIDNSVQVSDGTVIFHGAIIQRDTRIGHHCIINTAASVDHDCDISDFVHISPNATLCGNVSVGEGTHIGAGSVIIPNIKIGKWATIGAGSVIIKDIPDYAVVVGNPGKIIKYTCNNEQ